MCFHASKFICLNNNNLRDKLEFEKALENLDCRAPILNPGKKGGASSLDLLRAYNRIKIKKELWKIASFKFARDLVTTGERNSSEF